jgi:hypothetical protein
MWWKGAKRASEMTSSTKAPPALRPPGLAADGLAADGLAANAANAADGGSETVDSVAFRRREAASRALAEAEARRREADARAKSAVIPGERLGRGGLDPVRYGDWEVKGITSDF